MKVKTINDLQNIVNIDETNGGIISMSVKNTDLDIVLSPYILNADYELMFNQGDMRMIRQFVFDTNETVLDVSNQHINRIKQAIYYKLKANEYNLRTLIGTLDLKYNPIENYNMVEHEEHDNKTTHDANNTVTNDKGAQKTTDTNVVGERVKELNTQDDLTKGAVTETDTLDYGAKQSTSKLSAGAKKETDKLDYGATNETNTLSAGKRETATQTANEENLGATGNTANHSVAPFNTNSFQNTTQDTNTQQAQINNGSTDETHQENPYTDTTTTTTTAKTDNITKDYNAYTDTTTNNENEHTDNVTKETSESKDTETHTGSITDKTYTDTRTTNVDAVTDTTTDIKDEDNTDTGTRDLTRSGNIGVTTSQQMIEQERQLATLNIVRVICDHVIDAIAIGTYNDFVDDCGYFG